MIIDYQVRLLNFPTPNINEVVTENPDGSYTIFIEASLAREEQQNAFKHALKHILGNDFEKIDINEIEARAHNFEFSSELSLVV